MAKLEHRDPMIAHVGRRREDCPQGKRPYLVACLCALRQASSTIASGSPAPRPWRSSAIRGP